MLACAGFESARDDDVVTGTLEVNGRSVEGHAWCFERTGEAGPGWMLALSDEHWDVHAVGVRVDSGVGLYEAAKGAMPQGPASEYGVVGIGEEACVEVQTSGPGAGSMTFDCVGEPTGVEYPGGHEVLSVRGTLEFRNCPFP